MSLDSAGERRGFVWKHGLMTDIGSLGGYATEIVDLNDAGQVAGTGITASGDAHAFLWSDGSLADLGTLGSSISVASALNNSGAVVGASVTGQSEWRAFVWQHGAMRDVSSGRRRRSRRPLQRVSSRLRRQDGCPTLRARSRC